ncbi:hypothetical protein [Candidatus Proelusimicrobium excrementi]|uniref:hypothetical protein n=1 Tax=Candidatus Proelusimicrobium excrementi TaxID=3416222 RepID=UPI003D0D47B8
MRYLVIAAAALFIMGGCSSSSKKDDSAAYQNQVNAENNAQESVILDQEFDLLVAPEYDYETEVPYAEQIKNVPAKKQQAVKSAKKPAAIKK